MSTYATDTDLLLWEPNLPAEAAIASQTLLSGSADLTGTTLTIAAGSLAAAHVEPDQVVALSGAITGCYPIISIESATQMTISILYAGTWPDVDPPVPSPVGAVAGVSFAIRSFYPQRRVISDLLDRIIDLPAGVTLLNPDVLRRPCALGTIQMIYSALAAAVDAPEIHQIRCDLYERLYRRALRDVVLHLDTLGDGRIHEIRRLNVLQLARG